jgi:hypothetical protein
LPNFPELDARIRKALNTFSNKVFIKLNWSSPKDAYWSLNRLFCQRLSDVYMLLKSSDFINHDLNEAFNDCEDRETSQKLISDFKYHLIIREWLSINPSMEFRCFVSNNKLIGKKIQKCFILMNIRLLSICFTLIRNIST